MKSAHAHGHTAKHSSSKHGSTSKHHPKHPARRATAHKSTVHAVAKKAAAAKPRGWSPDAEVALCSARAVAEAIRLCLGSVLSDADVLSLYWATAATADAGQSVSDALSAARWLYAERYPGEHLDCVPVSGVEFLGKLDESRSGCASLLSSEVAADRLGFAADARAAQLDEFASEELHALILGLDLPWGEPHAVTYDPADGAWWSWGQPYDPEFFVDAVVEEIWQVDILSSDEVWPTGARRDMSRRGAAGRGVAWQVRP